MSDKPTGSKNNIELWSKSLKYYRRNEVQEAIVREAKNREVGVRMINGGFGKRPDILSVPSEIFEFARKKVVSFHFSEELWSNPLAISTAKSTKDLEQLRIGWDLVLDVDGVDFEISRIATKWFLKVLDFYEVDHYVKFSGNKGFHIGVPFQNLPEEVIVNGESVPIKNLYPETPRRVASYIEQKVRFRVKEDIEKMFSPKELSEKSKKKNPTVEDLINIDTILISSRHLFRAPYSMHEKSGLVSIPIKANHVGSFSKEEAEPENVETERWFIKRPVKFTPSARKLIISAFDYQYKEKRFDGHQEQKKNYENINMKKINLPKEKEEQLFPPCILKLDKGLNEGRKRGLFVYINFLHSLGFDKEDIEKRIYEWNERNTEPLREAYVKTQLRYYLSRKPMLPPNCNKEGFYKELGICEPNSICRMVKNPVGFTRRVALILNESKKKNKKRKKKGKDKNEN